MNSGFHLHLRHGAKYHFLRRRKLQASDKSQNPSLMEWIDERKSSFCELHSGSTDMANLAGISGDATSGATNGGTSTGGTGGAGGAANANAGNAQSGAASQSNSGSLAQSIQQQLRARLNSPNA